MHSRPVTVFAYAARPTKVSSIRGQMSLLKQLLEQCPGG